MNALHIAQQLAPAFAFLAIAGSLKLITQRNLANARRAFVPVRINNRSGR